MEWQAGDIVRLNVLRVSDFGYFIGQADNDMNILLHRREANRELEIGEDVEVFLYHDHQNRLAATMTMPMLQFEQIAWLEIVSVEPGHGVFLYNGISRDLFLSMDELPTNRKLWPQPGDKLPVSLTRDKKGRLMGRLVRGQPIEKQSGEAKADVMNQELYARVYHFGEKGVFLLTELKRYIAFLHEDEYTYHPRLGERMKVRVTFVRPDGRINVTAKPLRSEQQSDDAEQILAYLNARNGAMPYSDKSQPEDIKKRFTMSKSAFKRGLGKLLKEGKIEQRDGWTYVKEEQ